MTEAEPKPYAQTNDLPSQGEPTLSDRLEAAKSRIAERTAPARERASEQARSAYGSTKRFVTDHPFLAVTGAVAAGALIALALPGKPGRKMRGSALALGGLAAELAATYGTKMLAMTHEAAEASQEKLEEIGESFAAASETALDAVRDAGDAVVGQTQSLAAKVKR